MTTIRLAARGVKMPRNIPSFFDAPRAWGLSIAASSIFPLLLTKALVGVEKAGAITFSYASLVAVLAISWGKKREIWFWMFWILAVACHGAVIYFLQFPDFVGPAIITFGTLAAVDILVMLSMIHVLSKFFEKDEP